VHIHTIASTIAAGAVTLAAVGFVAGAYGAAVTGHGGE